MCSTIPWAIENRCPKLRTGCWLDDQFFLQVEEKPNLIVKLTREEDWTKQHSDIMGPDNSYLYFGPSRSQGYLVYGNGEPKSMAEARTQKKEASRYVDIRVAVTSY